MPFLPPGEYLRGLYVVCERGILGGGRREREGDCGGRGGKSHRQLEPKGFDLNAVELYF